MAQGLTAAVFAALIVVAGPAAPKAQAIPDWLKACNLLGGDVVCEKFEKGAEWLYDNTGADYLAAGMSETIDFASDPLGYLQQKLHYGTQGAFSAFGEELTGEKPPAPKYGKRFIPRETKKTFRPVEKGKRD